MKTWIIATAVTCMAWAALAQGQFVFGNRNILADPPLDARAFAEDGISPLLGTRFWAQAYVGLTLDSMAPVGTPVNFRTSAAAGYIHSTTVTTPFPDGTKVWVEMRVWETGWASYEAAVTGRGRFGKSDPIQLTVAEPPNTPPEMLGLQSFSLVPEPSPSVLGLLGAVALMLRRHS